MEINVRERDSVTILKPSGKIFGPAALDFKKVFDEQLGKVSGSPRFLVDFAYVTIMGSSGLGALMAAYTAIESQGGLMALINVGTNIENLIVRSKLIDTFEPFENEDEAVEALNAD